MKTLKGKATSAIIFNTDTKDHSIDNYALAPVSYTHLDVYKRQGII